MRIWSIHPQYLDPKGLVALWRETLLAKHVLEGKTKGYKNHPQLNRFKACSHPREAINQYLQAVLEEALTRGYNFDKTKIGSCEPVIQLTVTHGQVNYEFKHLLQKLQQRDHERFLLFHTISAIAVHPLFRVVKGPIEPWEIL
ncbi:MAG TPA: pyrimidine dimer DNA glycosylase/endonuclease V [Phnomibacter sp.]|nr:pyrimidine dimer DNA glycosylase/endonuclease V [Phnomibacter sp.]